MSRSLAKGETSPSKAEGRASCSERSERPVLGLFFEDESVFDHLPDLWVAFFELDFLQFFDHIISQLRIGSVNVEDFDLPGGVYFKANFYGAF